MECKRCGSKGEDKLIKSGSKKLYCSDKCKDADARDRRREKIREQGGTDGINHHICEKCGNKFINNRKETKYCSTECSRTRKTSISPSGEKLLRCSICKESKPLSDEYFQHAKSTIYGYKGHCKECDAKKSKTPAARKYQAASRKRRAAAIKQYEKKRCSSQEYKSKRNLSEMLQARTDPSFALKRRMRVLMYHNLRSGKGGKKWQDLTGYTIEQLKRHLETKFTDGMTWERFMDGAIHIDHKIPISAHNITSTDDPDFKKAWALKNLQPLWAFDNISKNDKLYEPFQPSLPIGASNHQSSSCCVGGF